MERGVKLDRWGYEVSTSSDSCISSINDYYYQVLLSFILPLLMQNLKGFTFLIFWPCFVFIDEGTYLWKE